MALPINSGVLLILVGDVPMELDRAVALARALGGEAKPNALKDGSWVVLIRRADGWFVALNDELVTEYPTQQDLLDGRPYAWIRLRHADNAAQAPAVS